MTATDDANAKGFETYSHVDGMIETNSEYSRENLVGDSCANSFVVMSDPSETHGSGDVKYRTEISFSNDGKSEENIPNAIHNSMPTQEHDALSENDEWLDIMGSGDFKKKVLKPGLGPETRPHRGDVVTISVIFYVNGIEFEKDENQRFIVGDFDVIQGLDLVICLMEKEEKSTIIIPSKLAYGELGRLPHVPPNSAIECDVELKDVETVDEDFFTVSKRLELGNAKRERGNYFYDRGEFIDAIHCYERAAEYLDGVGDCSDSTTRELQGVVDMRIKVYNNLAAAHLKLCAYSAALKSVESVLKIQPQNVKALFRKAKILGMQGSTEEAIACLKIAAGLEPGTKVIQTELTKLIRQRKKEEQSQRAMYQRMFKSEPHKPGAVSWMKKWSMVTCGVLAVAVGSAVAYRQYHT